MSHTALLIIDAQRAFEHDPEWAGNATTTWLHNQNRLIENAQHAGWHIAPVFHHSRGLFDPTGEGVLPVPGLALPQDGTRFIKHVHNALQAHDLTPWLANHGVSHLVISGIRTEQCCETTARAARDAGFDVDFVLDATLTFSMATAAGGTVSAEAIKAHTATVLQRRFASVVSVEDVIKRNDPATLNRHCPRSGSPVDEGSVTEYRNHLVGFCNPGCRDDFANNTEACVAERRHFDQLIALQAGTT